MSGRPFVPMSAHEAALVGALEQGLVEQSLRREVSLFEDLDVDQATSAECAQAAAVELGIREGGATELESFPGSGVASGNGAEEGSSLSSAPRAFFPAALREGARCEAEEPGVVRRTREAAISRSKLAGPGFDPTPFGTGVTTWCSRCSARHTAPTADELVELIDGIHAADRKVAEAIEAERERRWRQRRDAMDAQP